MICLLLEYYWLCCCCWCCCCCCVHVMLCVMFGFSMIVDQPLLCYDVVCDVGFFNDGGVKIQPSHIMLPTCNVVTVVVSWCCGCKFNLCCSWWKALLIQCVVVVVVVVVVCDVVCTHSICLLLLNHCVSDQPTVITYTWISFSPLFTYLFFWWHGYLQCAHSWDLIH